MLIIFRYKYISGSPCFADGAFAGHSLGEYSALASISDVLHISALVDVCFYRGITMQRAVECDYENRSNYAMCAVNPSRISPTFSNAALREVVDSIATRTASLDYNVEVSLVFLITTHSISYVLIGSTICLCRGTRCSADYGKCDELPESAKD